MSKVSVALTTYNGARFLLPQLQSLLSQSRQPDEVVICDDGSTDNTAALLRQFVTEYGLSNWHIYENAGNLGYIRNFRKAMSLTSGDIVFLCDQDDVWDKEKIAQMAAVMESDPCIAALACGYGIIDENGEPLKTNEKKFYTPPSGGSDLTRVECGRTLYSNIAQGCAGAYRRCIIDAYCSAVDCRTMPHDWAMYLIAYQQKGLYFLDRELLLYRVHSSNTTGISDSSLSASQRIPRLVHYAQSIADAVHLPLCPEQHEEARALASFTHMRIQWLREKRLKVWISGFLQNIPILREYFFWQYMKDLVLVLLRKIPNETDPE